MSWTNANFPPAMRNLARREREKAIEIANALLDDGMLEARATRMAIAKAHAWAAAVIPQEREGEALCTTTMT